MGLDVSAIYATKLNMEEVPSPLGCDDDQVIHIVNEHPFGDRLGGRDAGIYWLIDSKHFYRNSYGGYNEWRRTLAEIVGYPHKVGKTRSGADVGAWEATSGPFWELIYFSDCEGYIGGTVLEKLHKDFADWKNRIDEWVQLDTDHRGDFLRGYLSMQECFSEAVEWKGFVEFA